MLVHLHALAIAVEHAAEFAAAFGAIGCAVYFGTGVALEWARRSQKRNGRLKL